MSIDSEKFWRENQRPGTTLMDHYKPRKLWQRLYDCCAASNSITGAIMTPEHDKPTHEMGHSEAIAYVQRLRAENSKLIAQVEALTVPQGWKLVPMEPTAEMLVAGAESDDKDFGPVIHNCYAAMIAAAPTIPAIP